MRNSRVIGNSPAARTSYFKLPAERTLSAGTPMSTKRSDLLRSVPAPASTCVAAAPIERRRARYRGRDRFEMRPLTTMTGMPARSASTSMRGHSSLSTRTSARGCKRLQIATHDPCKIERVIKHACRARCGISLSRARAYRSVPAPVSARSAWWSKSPCRKSGSSVCIRSIRRLAAITSPTETAWIQIVERCSDKFAKAGRNQAQPLAKPVAIASAPRHAEQPIRRSNNEGGHEGQTVEQHHGQ